jgi:hypothetical protein
MALDTLSPLEGWFVSPETMLSAHVHNYVQSSALAFKWIPRSLSCNIVAQDIAAHLLINNNPHLNEALT